MVDNRAAYYLNSDSSVVQFETIELSHPDFAASHFFVRNNANGLTVTLETMVSQDFLYLPMEIVENGSSTDIDYSLSLKFGDLGESLPADLDSVSLADGLFTEPTVKYRTYRSDDLTTPMFGPIELKVKSFSFNKFGAEFEAVADQANSQQTGEIYTIDRFPMLRGFL